ncbi:crotonase/enoyl-CoA hydratase family protein [Azospirillum rugosum]|uniref:Enoyl-CoA hydratase/carnithine racemase n=1 Tax=Azospirillum rugosum TaxID=416170 RepID=A0ABS4SEH5_9PROT|nr:crotonase/enoyl-CoA hydratase family protein [Azospirillum rugosum]MBP2290991.1 enoyl-CoA hydratase/carnithine racemase [Azospirillum rugosum]MDQ0524945.1 enoyl-CoA hydratase/carnithine racemase [Azospirillum rugosum]
MPDLVLRTTAGAIAILTLNRPEKLNAISTALANAMHAALDALEADEAVRAVIVTGAGERAFSAGADITEFTQTVRQGPGAAVRAFRPGQTLCARIEAFPKPVIAAVNGICFGGGCEILEASHLAVASERALFSKAEIKLGMMPTFGGTQRLPRTAGRKRALEWLLTGDSFPPATALAMGLVNRVVAPDALMPAALELAERITRHSPEAVAGILTAATRGLNLTIGEGLAVETEQFAKLAPGAALRDGLEAWLAR